MSNTNRTKSPAKKPPAKKATTTTKSASSATPRAAKQQPDLDELILSFKPLAAKAGDLDKNINEVKACTDDARKEIAEFVADFDTKVRATVIDFFEEVNKKLGELDVTAQTCEQKLDVQHEILTRLERKLDAIITQFEVKYEEPSIEPIDAAADVNQHANEHRDGNDGDTGGGSDVDG